MTNISTEKSIATIQHKSLIYVLLVLAIVYFPFANKAFTVDDTLFIKAAEQILVTPFDFYGGEVNWYGVSDPHYEINKNPPLVSYLIAAVASIFGFSEVALHTFFFLPLALSAIGIYLLGRQFKASPLIVTALAIFTPVFLVHGTNLMSDSTMLMFWVWGLVFWMNGVRTTLAKWFFLAGCSVALGILTKYTCLFLLPLMCFSGMWHFKKPGIWTLAVFIPIAALSGFEYYTHALYGNGLFFEAFVYADAQNPKKLIDYFDNTLLGLSFLGGCFPISLMLIPLTGKLLSRLVILLFAVGVMILISTHGSIAGFTFAGDSGFNASLIFQFCAFSLAGACLVLACLNEIRRGFDHDSIFLLLWFFGIFIFVCYLNWTINARSFILLVPAVGILLSRRLDEWGSGRNFRQNISYAMIGIAGLIAVATVHADFIWAGTARVAAKEITSKYKETGGVWFQGHWGFQYYMEKLGASPVNFRGSLIRPGDFVISPVNNSNVMPLEYPFVLVDIVDFSQNSFLVTMGTRHGAGFYSSLWGVAPYMFRKSGSERYLVYRKAK